MLAVLLGLGTWQIERLQWKHNLILEIGQRMKLPPIDVGSITDPTDLEYHPITASGLFQPGQELYLHAISRRGEAGYHILAPLKLINGLYLLVDRGWVPLDRRDPEMRPDGEVFGLTSVSGLLRIPHHHWMQPKNYPGGNDWYGYDLKTMAETEGLPDFLSFVLEVDASKPNPGGYPLGGQTYVDLPNNHFIYAVIWFSLALALLVIYGVQGWKPLKENGA
jgi:surfeit locus 1 family protein